MFCYTNELSDFIQPKAPGGGGFGCEVIDLEYLYHQYKGRNNIWTKTNQYTDLCRYTGCKITLYRHPSTDFIFQYNIQPPFHIEKYTYQDIQPLQMLLKPHKRIILSRDSNPKGKLKTTVKIKPPKELSTKWFFQKDFSKVPLVQLNAAAADLRYATLGCCNVSQMATLYALNSAHFFKKSNWGQYNNQIYKPYDGISLPMGFLYTEKGGAEKVYAITQDTFGQGTTTAYLKSISRSIGWFNPRVLLAKAVYTGTDISDRTTPTELKTKTLLGVLPIVTARYNPNEDDGSGNEVWLTSIFHGQYDKPAVTPDYIITGVPLYIALYGYWNYLIEVSSDKGIMNTHMFVVKSKAIRPLQTTSSQDYYPLVDLDFLNGKLPYDQYISEDDKTKWFPTAENQIITLNTLVQTGPYIPRLDNIKNSTWELRYKYCFYFKWGGPQTTDPIIDDPHSKGDYPTPGTINQRLQITNPEKQIPETMFHSWDYRRGVITEGAIKRMSENLQTDSSIQSDDSETPAKKRKISKKIPNRQEKESKLKKCLLSLYEEDTYQETPENIQQLLQQQHQHQHKLKRNILKLLTHLKKKQRLLSLQTGIVD